MFGNRHKHIKNIKSKDDALNAFNELESILSSFEEDYETTRTINKIKFICQSITFEDYQRKNAEIDKNQSLDKVREYLIVRTSNKGMDEQPLNKYAEENVYIEYEKELSLIDYTVGNISQLEYEKKLCDISKKPYGKILLSPHMNNSSKVDVEVIYNDHFVDQLIDKDNYQLNYDENDELMRDDLVEQWFQTTIIVLAANTLKESDLETFRSVAESDHSSVSIMEEVQFDTESMENVTDEQKKTINNILSNKNFYR